MFKVLDIPFSGTRLEGLTRSTTICEYRGNINSSGNLIDYSGKGHHLTPSATFSSIDSNIQDNKGNIIRSAYYNGTNYFSCAHHDDFNCFDANHTITALVRDDLITTTLGIFSHGQGGVSGIGLIINGVTYRATVSYSSGSGYVSVTNTSTISQKIIYIIQIVRSSDISTLYINGTAGVPLSVASYGIDVSRTFYLGANDGANTNVATIPYFRIDTEALSTTELAFERDYLSGCVIGIPSIFNKTNSVLSSNKKYWTFTRSTIAYNTLNNRSLIGVGPNIPRIDSDKSLLLEKSTTNYTLHSSDLTDGFKESRPAGDANVNWQSCASDYDGSNLIVGSISYLYTSSNYGLTWTERQPAGAVTKRWSAVASDDDGSNLIACVGVSAGRAYLSIDSGSTWNEATPAGAADMDWRDAAMDSDGSVIVLAAYGKRLWITTNSGGLWSELRPSGVDADYNWFTCCCDSDGSVIYAGIANGRLWVSTNTGSTWTETRPAGDANKNWSNIKCSADGSIAIASVDASGRLYVTTTTGAAWSEVRPNGDAGFNWRALAISADGTIMYAGTDAGLSFKSTNSGTTWTQIYPTGTTGFAWRKFSCSKSGHCLVAPTYSSGRLWINPWGTPGLYNISTNGKIFDDANQIMDGIIGDSTDTIHGVAQAITLTANPFTSSAFFAPGNKSFTYISNDSVANAYAYFDLTNKKVLTTGAGCLNAQIEGYGNLTRCGITFTGIAGTNIIKYCAANADGDNDFAGDGVTVNTWIAGAQVEQHKHWTSYYATTTASASRSADVMTSPTIPNIGSMPGIIGNTYHYSKLHVEFEAKMYYPSNSYMGETTYMLEISGNTGTASSTRNRLYIRVEDPTGVITTKFYDNSSTEHILTSIANPVTFSNWNTYKIIIDCADLTNMDMKFNGTTGVNSSSNRSGTAVFDMTNCAIRLMQTNDGQVFESEYIKNIKFWVG